MKKLLGVLAAAAIAAYIKNRYREHQLNRTNPIGAQAGTGEGRMSYGHGFASAVGGKRYTGGP